MNRRHFLLGAAAAAIPTRALSHSDGFVLDAFMR